MARAALAVSSLALLLVALPTAQAADLSDVEGCIGPKLTGDQALIARPYPGGGFEVFVGVDSSSPGVLLSGDADRSGGDYTGAGAYVLGPGCEADALVSALAPA